VTLSHLGQPTTLKTGQIDLLGLLNPILLTLSLIKSGQGNNGCID